MACTEDFIDFICNRLTPAGEIRTRKMMGDYVIYVNEKYVITACDNIAYIKKLPCLEELMADAETGSPYPGAKEAYILNFDDMHKVFKIIDLLWQNLPYPKARNKK